MPGRDKWMDVFDRPIFVLGLPRSGTSLVAGVLGICNAWMGRTLPGGVENPKGFFEHIILREQVNKKILAQLGCDPLGVTSLPPPGAVRGIPGLRDTIYRVISAEGYDGKHPWLLKDAKITLLWPAYLDAFPDARWIIVRREVDDIVKSCLNTPFMNQHSSDPGLWRGWAEEYLLRLEKLKSVCPSSSEIWPQQLVEGELGPLRELVANLGLEWKGSEVNEFIDSSCWHGSGKSSPG